MNKAVMLSIQPKWCELIASGEKTIEVRKNRPQIETPFKCYIYCTNGQILYDLKNETYLNIERRYALGENKSNKVERSYPPFVNRKVIGEFVCDRIVKTCGWRLRGNTGFCAKRTADETKLPNEACLTIDEIVRYAGNENREICGWHISDLVIYDKPRELGEFRVRSNHPDCDLCAHVPVDMSPCEFVWHNDFCGECHRLSYKSMWATHFRKRLTRPPQSWCYVREV